MSRVHRIIGDGDTEALPTQAGMVRDTLKGIRRKAGARQRQAAPLRYGQAMSSADVAPEGLTIEGLLLACGQDLVGLRDAALCSMAYDAGLRVSELVAAKIGRAHV